MQTQTVVIPKSVKQNRILENFVPVSTSGDLDAEDLENIAKLDTDSTVRYFEANWMGVPELR
jgi:diketogulonate reductase-like aldo/keto reductase